jgi:hypothetical protein
MILVGTSSGHLRLSLDLGYLKPLHFRFPQLACEDILIMACWYSGLLILISGGSFTELTSMQFLLAGNGRKIYIIIEVLLRHYDTFPRGHFETSVVDSAIFNSSLERHSSRILSRSRLQKTSLKLHGLVLFCLGPSFLGAYSYHDAYTRTGLRP